MSNKKISTNDNNIINKIIRYGISGFITLGVVLLIYVAKGIWPFGDKVINFFDNMQQVAPLYCHLWDFLHGKASLWFDWYTGLGTNVSMSISAFSMLSPFNVLLYLVPRDYILQFLPFLTLFKMMFMAVSMYALINYRYRKTSELMKNVFAIMYAFGGYVIVYGSCFTPWMDIVALFPLLILSCDILVKTGKKLFYIVMVALMFIINYYLGAMSLIYILMAYGIEMVTRLERKAWGRRAWNIGIGTAAGMGLSVFVLAPVFMQLSTSQRNATSSNGSIISRYIGWITEKTFDEVSLGMLERMIMIYGMAFVFTLIIAGIVSGRRKRYDLGYTVLMLLLVLSPVIAEGTNLMWHFGSYNGYTLRMGYVIAFTLICLAAEASERVLVYDKIKRSSVIVQAVFAASGCILFIIGYNRMPATVSKYALFFFMSALVVFFVGYLVCFILKKFKVNPKNLIGFLVVELFMGAYAFIGVPKFYGYADYQIGDYCQLTVDAVRGTDIEESVTERITNPDISLNANYPLIMRRGSQSSFTAALLSDTQDYSVQFGYSKYFLWLLDAGGTVFSDALFHVTEAVNQNELDESLYTLKLSGGDMAEFKKYSCNYQLPFVMKIDDKLVNTDISSFDWIELQNSFYEALVEGYDILPLKNTTLIKRYNGKDIDRAVYNETSELSGLVSYSLDITDKEALYIGIKDTGNGKNDANVSQFFNNINVYINGEPVVVPTFGHIDNTNYSVDYNNNLLYLGTFDNESVNIRIEYKNAEFKKLSEVTIGGINLNYLGTLCDSSKNGLNASYSTTNSSLEVSVSDIDKDTTILVPVIYCDDNWSVFVDGKKADAVNVAGMFTAVRLDKGNHTISYEFKPKGKDIGFIVSIAVLLTIAACMVIGKVKYIKLPAFCENIAKWVYEGIFAVLLVFMFAVPIVSSLIVTVLSIIGIV